MHVTRLGGALGAELHDIELSGDIIRTSFS